MLSRCIICFLVIAMASAASAQARDLYVNHENGDDAATGAAGSPLRTIAAAIARAEPGDTIHLTPTASPYRESVVFRDRSGEEGRPITIDGHGATISGAEALDATAWEAVTPDLYRGPAPVSAEPSVTGRWSFLIDGRIERMGRSLKGPKQPWLTPDALLPGQWTWIEGEQRYYLRTPDKRPLAECDIRVPVRSSGVVIAGHCEHLVIRNLTATHVWNDGFNIHGVTRDVLFENVRAIECGDDGISAHDDCRIRVEGMVSMGNSTGVCHGNQSHSDSRNMYLAGNHGFEYYVLNTGVHELRDSRIICGEEQALVCVGDPAEGALTLRLENVLLHGTGAPGVVKADRNSDVEADRVTISGLSLVAAGASFSLHDSVIAGTPAASVTVHAGTHWTADRNLYDLDHLRIAETSWTAANFAGYRAATGQDAASTWTSVSFAMPFDGRVISPVVSDVGVDVARLPAVGVSHEEPTH